MKIVFHERYYNSDYARDPAAEPGRLEGIINLLSKKKEFEFINPEPAKEEDILRAHTESHYRSIKRESLLFELASLAAGGAILAASEGFMGNPTMIVIPVWASFSTLAGLKLNLEAFVSEYLIWSLTPFVLVYLFIKLKKEFKNATKLIFLGLLNLVPYFVYPSSFFSQIIITSNYRFTYPAMMPLMLSLFIIAKKYKFELKLAVVSILSTFAVLSQFSYRPKIIFIWLVLIIIINYFHKAFNK